MYLMDMDKWFIGNGEHFTDLAKWLGFKNCFYDSIRHDNVNGYHHDSRSINLGDNYALDG